MSLMKKYKTALEFLRLSQEKRHKLEQENATLTQRVAELERQIENYQASVTTLLEQIDADTAEFDRMYVEGFPSNKGDYKQARGVLPYDEGDDEKLRGHYDSHTVYKTGVIDSIKRLTTNKGLQMAILKLDTDVLIVVFPRTWQEHKDDLTQAVVDKTNLIFHCGELDPIGTYPMVSFSEESKS